jgi:hypothetical protein
MFKLYATRKTTASRYIGNFSSLHHAQQEVWRLERLNRWPEGFTATAIDSTGKKYVYTNDWQEEKDEDNVEF